ncbi:CvpA family protein [Robbsia sp. Bb-Pol-6]|uniref:CvpA family protein n=1 Tax=Robbsia betulipollinis TaxID=2981849 RepID=A0ABT3ZJB6_9BURK|nr:CvpA family protein [Robbsia betulipollinis]MCY0386447.1 CvpA family protein [Robbsia betulipollinis]
MLTVFDYAVLAVIVLSALRGAWRGLIAEAFSLVGWIVAFVLGARYAARIAPWIPANWPGGALTQWLVGFAAVTIGVILIAGVGNALLGRLTEASGLRSVDRSLGLLFGLGRGLLLVLLLYVAAGFTELPTLPFWRDALLRTYVEQGVLSARPFLPAPLQAYARVDARSGPPRASDPAMQGDPIAPRP